MARVFDLPAVCVAPDMVWPHNFYGTDAECHKFALNLSRQKPREITVVFSDRVVVYKQGITRLVS